MKIEGLPHILNFKLTQSLGGAAVLEFEFDKKLATNWIGLHNLTIGMRDFPVKGLSLVGYRGFALLWTNPTPEWFETIPTELKVIYQRRTDQSVLSFLESVVGKRLSIQGRVPDDCLPSAATFYRPKSVNNARWIEQWVQQLQQLTPIRGWYVNSNRVQLLQEFASATINLDGYESDPTAEMCEIGLHPLTPQSASTISRTFDKELANDEFITSLLNANAVSFVANGNQWLRGPTWANVNQQPVAVTQVSYRFEFEAAGTSPAVQRFEVVLKTSNRLENQAVAPCIPNAISIEATFDGWEDSKFARFKPNEKNVFLFDSDEDQLRSRKHMLAQIVAQGRIAGKGAVGLYFKPQVGDKCDVELLQGSTPRVRWPIQTRDSVPDGISSLWTSDEKVSMTNKETIINDNFKISSSESTFAQKSKIKDVEIG